VLTAPVIPDSSPEKGVESFGSVPGQTMTEFRPVCTESENCDLVFRGGRAMLGKSRRLLTVLLVLAIGVLLLPLSSFAASTGQIKGRITDAMTGDAVVGATVLVVGTTRGGTTDLDGYFQILRLDPATYTVRISSVEYATVEVTNVEVRIDETFEVNQKLSKSVTDIGKTITVVGQKKIIDPTVIGGQVSISQEAIEKRPVTNVDALLKQVPGVQTSAEGEVFIRGGRAGEVAYIVDGVPIGDPLGGSGQIGANLSLVAGSIQEIQIIKDGFDPEYGNALSGIINIRSQTGSKDNTRITALWQTDDLGTRSLNKFSRNYDYFKLSVSGPDPILGNRILPAMGLDFMKDQEFTYFLYFDMDKDDGSYKMQDYDTPKTRRSWPSYSLFGLDIPERLSNFYSGQANMKFRPRQNLKFVLSLKQWYTKLTRFGRDQWEYRYSNATAPVTWQDRTSVSLEVTQSVTKDMNYEMVLSVVDYESQTAPGDPNHPGQTLSPDKFRLESEWESFTDLNGNGVYDAPEPIINLYPDTASYGTNFNGPGYTFGEFIQSVNEQGGVYTLDNFRFNNNGVRDSLEGEPFLDLNGNGVWDRGDLLNDKNGNGVLDLDRVSPINNRSPEPYIDGDSILGEPFVDLNANGVFDPVIDLFVISENPETNQDLNYNGKYDGPNDQWTPGIPYLDRNGNGVYDAPNGQYDPGEPFTDANGNGAYDYGGNSTFLDPGSYDVEATWANRTVRTWRGELKVTRQAGRHELKGGFHFQRDEMTYGEISRPYLLYTGRADTTNAYSTRGAFRDFYKYSPVSGSAYFRDKIEYGSMVASLGLRWDFFLQDTKQLATTMRADDRGGVITGDRQKFSPRIGFSYPISDKAKVYFNYGHFFQLPDFVLMYARNTSSANRDAVVGNPNLNYQKTIQYSFGVKYAMSESYSLDVEGYFKDEFDKINPGQVREAYYTRQVYLNKDYGRSRGFEVTLEKRGGGYVNGQISYVYAFAYGKASKTEQQFLDDLALSREPLTESPLENDIRHTLSSNVQVFMPANVKPRLFGVPIPNGWSLTLETIIKSGVPFTPAATYPNISTTSGEAIETNSMRYPGTAVFDMRFEKEFSLAALDWKFIFWVANVFDSRNVVNVYTNTGRPDTQQNANQVVKAGSAFDNNPYNYDYARQIILGLEVSI
jgi:outer membrane receptor protein involved in Fe transport